MRAFIILFTLSVFFSCKNEVKEIVTMKDDVFVLADDNFLGRKTGTEGELKAADFIAKRFKELELQPQGTEGYFQEFTFKPSTNPHQEAKVADTLEGEGLLKGRNVIGFYNNNAETTVVIGAHYDHLGLGGEGSYFVRETQFIMVLMIMQAEWQ